MPTVRFQLPELHPAQQEAYSNPARFKVLVAGRRFGKSKLAGVQALYTMSRGGLVWWVSPTYDLSKRVGWTLMQRAFQPLEAAGYAEINRTDLIITLQNGGQFQAKSADKPNKLVGDGLNSVIIDEAGIVNELAWTESLRPALSDTKGTALLIGTPKGRNWFWRAYQMGQDPTYPEWWSKSYPTIANPFIDPLEIEDARRSIPQRVFEQEFLAVFLDNGGAVFRNIDAVCTAVPDEPQHPGGFYVMGLDWGRDNDFTAAAVFERGSRRMVALERFNEIGWGLQRARLKTLAYRWRVSVILAEENSIGSPNIEALQAEGLPVFPFQTTASSKAPLIEELALAIEQQSITLLNDPVLVGELQAYEMEKKPSGIWTYSAPPGGHDDTVIATALGVRAMNTQVQIFL